MTPRKPPPDDPIADRLDSATAEVLARAVEPAPASGGLRERLLASVARGGRYGIFVDRLARLFDLPAETVETLVAKLDDPSAWAPGPAAGIAMIAVRPGPRFGPPRYPNAVAAFGRLKPGVRFPHHAHKGDETTVVLAGGFRDSSGVEIERGEELYEAPGTDHDFVVLDGEDCIAAVIAVDGVEFT